MAMARSTLYGVISDHEKVKIRTYPSSQEYYLKRGGLFIINIKILALKKKYKNIWKSG